jgi:glycerol-3-phosphate dehydrogenase subunit B
MPPSVPGIRLREMFEQAFPARGLTLVPQQKVEHLDLHAGGARLYLKDNYGDVVIESGTTVLATGRFLSGGLRADRLGVHEPLLDLPVSQPTNRADWYRKDYLDRRGHPINRSGIEVDDRFRPLGADRRPVNERLFAAGVVLAHQDWIRQRCGAGVAIASAYRAVAGAAAMLK